MRLYEIALPEHDNTGHPYLTQHGLWQERALAYAGGYTEFPVANGVWRDDATDKVYQDKMICYRLACEEHIFRRLLAEAFTLFFDQIAIFTADLGEATIHARPKEEWENDETL